MLLGCLLLAFALPMLALERRTGERGVVRIAPDEIINDTVVAIGRSIDMEGSVQSNFIALGETVSIRGTVQGDVLCLARSCELEGRVEGNVFGAGQSLRLKGPGRVEQDFTVAGESVAVQGAIGRHLLAAAKRISLDKTTVGGNLTAHVPRESSVRIDPSVTIAGKKEIRVGQQRPSRYLRPGFYLWQTVWLAAAFLTGLLLRALFPNWFPVAPQTTAGIAKSIGIGFLVLMATPVAFCLIGITVVGLPVALLGLAVYLAALYLAKVFVASAIGQILRGPSGGGRGSFALSLLAGLVVVFVAINLPYVGGLLGFLVALTGIGVAATRTHRVWLLGVTEAGAGAPAQR